ncbi:CHAT domain-containing protein [Alteraurantiacibacter buctensis]|uniref:CHAT domain-containing protein n=1 Tax=Alteraurantiacibacter buctensis TaxID=1503981 RepID=A0A844YV77_9SPHN|nr:CHAT domain-containing protein [Alteraurantiacibacter buctensis]MXO70788.1 CHAT domain-containing protein [Alteraurantiacibacter buctensis]
MSWGRGVEGLIGALATAGALALAQPAAGQEALPTIEQMRARDVLAAPEGELAAWRAFTARVLADPASPPELVAESRLGLAIALMYAQANADGLAEWQAADALVAALPAPPAFLARHQATGSLLLTEAARLDEAEALARAALATAQAAGPGGLVDQALARNAQGMIAFARNDLAAAESAFCTARDLGLAAPSPYHAMVVNDASSCGAVKYYLERPDTLAAMRLASDHAHAHLPPDHPKMGNVLNSAYAVLLRYGRYAEAEPLIRRHLELERTLRTGDADEIYDPLSLLARALELRGAYADAEVLFRAAADMADRLRSATQPWARGRARGNLAVVLARQGRLDEAEAEARAGVERLVAELEPGNSNIGSGQVVWADQLERLGRRDEALAQVDEGLALLSAEYPPEHSEVIAARLIRARVLAGLGRTAEALEQSREASGLFAKQMFDLAASETDRVALSRVVPRAFADHVAVALAAGDMGEAVQAAQLLLLSEQGISNARIAAGALAREEGLGAAVDRLEAARAAVQAADKALAAAQASGSADAADLAPRLAAARDEAAAAQGALLEAFPQYAELARPQVPTLGELQAKLGAGEVLVLPLALPDRALTITVTRDAVAWGQADLPPMQVAALAERVRLSAQSPGAFDVSAARALHDVVFPAAVRDLATGARELLFPAAGYLARLSPAVLLTGAADPARLADAPWLVRRSAIRVVADLARLGPADAPLAARDFLGVGAPDGLPPALASAAASLPPLPRARAELDDLARALAPPGATVLAGAEASESALATLDLPRFGVIAFATHGLVGGEVAGLDEPALVLAGSAEGGSAEDGLLTASEIAGMKLAADWVILSACDTAAGQSTGAPGYSGLARAFAQAGARSLMLSHWRVRDDAAAFLSVETLRRAGTGDRAEALRQAQLALMARADLADAAHPAVWAPFAILDN